MLAAETTVGPIRQLVIQGTPYCNINCDYCYLPDRSSWRGFLSLPRAGLRKSSRPADCSRRRLTSGGMRANRCPWIPAFMTRPPPRSLRCSGLKFRSGTPFRRMAFSWTIPG